MHRAYSEKQLRHKIHVLTQEIRKATPLKKQVKWQKPASLFTREDYLNGERVQAASITLLPTGCEYAKTGGCTVCGEWSGSNLGELVHAEFHVAQFASACAGLFSSRDVQWLRIYQEGSFLNPREVDTDARDIILQLASNIRNIKRITIESRAIYLTETVAEQVRACIRPSVEIEIGIGLESSNNLVRNVCMGKGTSLASYENAVKTAHSNDIIALAYVLLKPPFMSEKQAIEDAINSVKYAFDIGFDEVYVQAASIHEWSLSELLWEQNLYKLPWLWSVLEVLKNTHHLGKVKIGGLEYFPVPATVSQNYIDDSQKEVCHCSENIWQSIQEYNATHDIAPLFGLTCTCQDTWKSLNQSKSQETAIIKTISETLDLLSLQNYLYAKKR